MEEEKQKIYVVTSGEYSDYTIERVFSTKKKALEYLDTVDDDYTLEEYDLDEPIERKTETYCISFRLDKKKVHSVSLRCTKGKAGLINISPRYFSGLKCLDIYVESDSRKRALKIASERYGAIIAGEMTMYPYLRVGAIRHYDRAVPAYFDFKTGELVLMKNQQLAIELPDFIKVKRLDID